jgi:hypothetical protein
MKSILLLIVVLLTTELSARAQDSLGRPASGTPYDRYLGPVRSVLARGGGPASSVDEVRAELRTARRFRYYFNPAEPYIPQAPEVTEAKKQGDCKAKSLWLATKMNTRGVRYVVGKAKAGDRLSHAWLLWSNGGVLIFLDPTMESDIVYADRVSGRKLVPNYSYTASGSYIHLDVP